MKTTYPLLANRLVYVIQGGGASASSYRVRASETDMLPGFLAHKIDSTLQIRENKIGVSGNVFDNFNSAFARIELSQQGLSSQFSDFSNQYNTFTSSFEQTAKGFAMAVYNEEIDKFSGEISEKYSTREHTADSIKDLVSNTTLDEYRNVVSQRYSTREQTATLISDQVYAAVFHPDTGVRSEMMSAINQTADNIQMYVQGNLYGPNGIQSAYLSEIEIAKGLIRSEVSETLYGEDGEGGIVAEYRTGIAQTTRDINLAVERVEGVETITSEIQLSIDSIDLGLYTNGKLDAGILIQRINEDTTIKIAASKVEINGSTTFAPGFNPLEIGQDLSILGNTVQEVIGEQETLNVNFENIPIKTTEALEEYNTGLISKINDMGNRKNARYVSETEPVLPEGETFRIGDEWMKVNKIIDEVTSEVSYEYTSYMWFGTSWEENLTVIDGARITTGIIDAQRIIAKELFAQEIGAVELNVVRGFIGGFNIDDSLSSETAEGTGISISPSERKIWIKDFKEGLGISQVVIRAGSLSSETELITGGSQSTYVSKNSSINFNVRKGAGDPDITSDNTRASNGVTIRMYIGEDKSIATPKIESTTPDSSNSFTLAAGKNYTSDMPFQFEIHHSGGRRNKRYHKLHGDLVVSVKSKLIGLTSIGAKKELTDFAINKIDISRSTNSQDVYKITTKRKVSFYNADCIRAFWELDVNIKGNLTYQQWTNQGLWNYYWMTSTGFAIDYQAAIPPGLSFNPSAGITEITTSGMQMMWSAERFLRINGEDSTYFIQSNGDWIHHGKLMLGTARVVTSDTIMDDVDLSAYATKNYIEDNYYNKTLSDGRFALKGGSPTQDFTVKNLIIHGQVDHYVGQTLVVDDARIRLNRSNGAATVASGIDIANGADVVSSLDYSTDGIWTLGGQRIYTDAYKPDSDALGGYSAASYPRKAENAVITGGWRFMNGDVHLVEVVTYIDATAKERISGFKLGRVSTQNTHHWEVYARSNKVWGEYPDFHIELQGIVDTQRFPALRISAQPGTQGFVGLGLTGYPQERLHVAGNGLFEGYIGTSNFVSQSQGWRITPAGIADFRHIYTNELQAKAFTADISQALVGSDVLTKSVAKLAQNWATTANGATSTIYVEELEGFPGFQVFAVGDRLLLRLFDRSGGGLLIKNIWATVASYVSTTKNVQRYTITVNSGGVTGHTVYQGSMILDYGTSGSGVIERTVLDAMGSPYSQVKTWVNDPSNSANYTIHNRTGNLDGIANASGFGFYGENTFLTGKLLVGDLTKAGQFMEYENGQLNIKGQITVTGGNAATKADVDAVQIGGRNLVEKTNQGRTNLIIDSSAGATTWTPSEEIVDGVRCAKGVKNTTAVETWALFNLKIYTPSKFRANKQYAISFKMNPSFAVNNQVTGLSTITNQGLSTNSDTYSLVAGEWNHVKLVVTTVSDFDTILAGRTTVHLRLSFVGNSSTGDTVLLKDIMIEEGNKASAYAQAPEDVDAEILSAKQEALTAAGNAQSTANSANTAVGNLSGYVDGAFKDGVIDAAEAKAIEKYKNTLNEAMAIAESSYLKVYTNTYLSGTPKTALQNAKINLWGQRDTLINAINTAISGGTTTASQKVAVDNAFTSFNSLMAAFQNALEEANKAIQVKLDDIAKGYVDDIEVGGQNLALETNQGTKNWVWGMQTGGYTATEHIEDGISGAKLTRNSTPHSGWSYGGYKKIGRDKLERGETYMITLDVFTNKASTLLLYFRAANIQYELISSWDYKNNTCTANTWSRIVLKATLRQTFPPETNQLLYIAGLNTDTNAYYIFRNLKIEKGNKRTTWTPAPEDVPSALEYLATAIQDGSTDIEGGLVATNVMLLKDANGVVRGGMSGLADDNVGFWAGGGYQNALDGLCAILFRKDGTGHIGKGAIRFKSEGIELGDMNLDEGGAWSVKEDESLKLLISRGNIMSPESIYIGGQSEEGTFGSNFHNVSGEKIEVLSTYTIRHDGTQLTIKDCILSTWIQLYAINGCLSSSIQLQAYYPATGRNVHIETLNLSVSGTTESRTGSKTVNKTVIVPAGYMRLRVVFNNINHVPGVVAGFYSQQTAGTIKISHNTSNPHSEIGRNGFMFVKDAYNLVWFGVDHSNKFRAVLRSTGDLDMPGVLLRGTVESGGGSTSTANWWGPKNVATGVSKTSTGRYAIYHMVDHVNYTVTAASRTANRSYHIVSINNTHFIIEWRTIGSSPTLIDTTFDFTISGQNFLAP